MEVVWMAKARLENEGTFGNKRVGNTELKENNETRRNHSGSTRIGHGFEENEYRQLGADSESPSKSFPG
jgi:hypothetical protein